MRFMQDDIVKIGKDSDYYGTYCNPKDVKGIIVGINTSPTLPIKVYWDNEEFNFYDEIDLKLVKRY